MQPHPSTIPVSPWAEILKGAKINFPVLKGKPKNQEQLTKSDIDFMKDFMSKMLSAVEYRLVYLKEEAKRTKEHDPFHSDMCYKDYSKVRSKLKKIAAIQKKIKSLR